MNEQEVMQRKLARIEEKLEEVTQSGEGALAALMSIESTGGQITHEIVVLIVDNGYDLHNAIMDADELLWMEIPQLPEGDVRDRLVEKIRELREKLGTMIE